MIIDLEAEVPAKSKVLRPKKISPTKRAESLPKAAAPVKKQRLDRGSRSIVRAEKVPAKPKVEEQEDEKTPYFWKTSLHQEFMRHFQIYGKTWKVVSAKMAENGILNKDQLQCRTHGQKYLLSLQEIQRNIEENQGQMDKKIYQKMIRYEEDKRYLYQKYLED